jgi:hypothetical protein
VDAAEVAATVDEGPGTLAVAGPAGSPVAGVPAVGGAVVPGEELLAPLPQALAPAARTAAATETTRSDVLMGP